MSAAMKAFVQSALGLGIDNCLRFNLVERRNLIYVKILWNLKPSSLTHERFVVITAEPSSILLFGIFLHTCLLAWVDGLISELDNSPFKIIQNCAYLCRFSPLRHLFDYAIYSFIRKFFFSKESKRNLLPLEATLLYSFLQGFSQPKMEEKQSPWILECMKG